MDSAAKRAGASYAWFMWSWYRVFRGTLRPLIGVAWGLVWFSLVYGVRAARSLSDSVTWPPVFDEIFAALCFALLILAAYVDSVCRILPDPLVIGAGCVASFTADGEALLLAVTVGTIAYIIASVTSLGFGDVKLLIVVSLVLGDFRVVAAACGLASLGAGTFAIVSMLLRRSTRTSVMALGPWIVGSALVIFLVIFPSTFSCVAT